MRNADHTIEPSSSLVVEDSLLLISSNLAVTKSCRGGLAAMASEHTGRTVFEYVEPDPDAVLEADGIDSPEELLPAFRTESSSSKRRAGTDWSFVGHPDTIISRQDRSVERATARLTALQCGRQPAESTEDRREGESAGDHGVELVGPDPTTTRIGDDRFGASNGG